MMGSPMGDEANVRGNDLPEPPGPSAEEAVQHMVDWLRSSHDFHRPDNPPAWVADEATWEKAKAAVEPYWGNYAEPYAVVTHVYENMGGAMK
jgi:hypothetical protein